MTEGEDCAECAAAVCIDGSGCGVEAVAGDVCEVTEVDTATTVPGP